MVFDDLVDENVHTPSKNAHSVNKRSSTDERHTNVADLMDIEDSDDHWLWGSVKRIRRSIDKLLGTENPSDVSETTESQPTSTAMPKHRKKTLPSESMKKQRKAKSERNVKLRGNKKLLMRPKRQEYEDLEDEEEDEDDEILEPNSSGHSYIPGLYPEHPDVPEKEDRLCKCFFFFCSTSTLF